MTLQEQLDSAKIAYHSLMTGKAVRVAVDQNGERVEYTSANAERLRAYINELEAQIAAGGGTRRRRPLRVWF